VNYMWGTTGIGLNTKKVKDILGDVPLNTWDLVLKPEIASKLKACGIYMLDSPEDLFPGVLAYLGLTPDSKRVEDLNKAGDALFRVRGLPGSGFSAPIRIGSGWNAFNLLEAAGDYDYDGVPDLLARDASGRLFVYPFNRDQTFKARIGVGAGGWQGMLSVTGAGAFNGDANGDVIALRASDHALVFYRGDGPNPLQDAVVLRTRQNDLAQTLGVGDYNGDGRADLMARATDGRLWLYPGNGAGALADRQPVRGGEGAGHVLG